MNNFNLLIYKLVNDDLANMTNEELHNHYFTYGINENRIYNIPNFNIDDYRNYNDDLKHMTDKQLINHYFEYGRYENRITEQDISNNIDQKMSSNIDQEILNNKDQEISNNKYHVKNKIELIKNKLELMKNNEKLISNNVKQLIMGNIAVYSNYYYTKFLNYTFCPIFDIIKIDTSMNKNYNYLLHNISIFTYITNKKNIKPSTHVLIINDSKINISFFKYNVLSLEKIVTLFNSSNTFDIIQLSVINTVDNFYKSINNKFTVLKASNNEIKHINLDCYLISVNGMNKIIKNKDNKIDLLTNVNIGYITRPYFMNNDDYNQSKNDDVIELWNKYYRVTSYWDNIFCINLGLDIDKRKNMIKYCNLLNANNKTFFYRGILGSNLPNVDTLKILKIYNNDANNNLKNGTIGLNVTQLKLINECIEKNYKHVLLLEDDINFNEKIYLNVLDYIFNKYETIDILYLGCSNYEPNINNIMNKIDSCCAKGSSCGCCKINVDNSGKKEKSGGKVCDIYNIYEPKKDLLQKICIGGMFAVLMSNKALKIYRDRFTPINNISDVLLCDITFNIKNDYNDKNIMIKTDYDLKTFYIVKNLFNVDITKPSMTDNNLNDIPSLSKIINNKYINYLSKIKQIQFINEHGTINIYISETCTKYYKYILSIILSKFKKVNIGIKNGNNHINIYTIHDNPDLFINKNYNNCINICINGENKVCQQNTDIGIITNYNFTNSFNIYFPQIFLSLWERRSYTILNNKKTHFCAYMYSYDVPHRVELFKYISSYKQVDALGKSCNNLYENEKDNTRDIYNDNETYNDIAVSIYSKYKFVLALENVNSPGYVTEKILNPILAGSIPIYYGSSDAFKIINKKRVIYVNDYKNYEDLLNIIKLVDSYKEFYNRIINEPIFSSSLSNADTKGAFGTTTTNITNIPITDTKGAFGTTITDTKGAFGTTTTDTKGAFGTTITDTKGAFGTTTTDTKGAFGTTITDTKGAFGTTITDTTGTITTNLEYTLFESILSNKLDKAFNIIPKKILIRNNKHNNIYNIKYDLIINDLKISKNIKDQISDFINKDDIVIINEGREIKDKKGKGGKKDNGNKKEKEDNENKKVKEGSINYINKILWINLDKSVDRNTYMNELFKNIPIENIRISAVNGYNDDINSLIDDKNSINITETLKIMSMPEIACTMSHIKAINLLNSIEGEYFLICEDDITFTNLNLIPGTLEEIIKNAPLFDILLITKIYCNKLDNIYTNWNDEYKRGNGTHDYQICSTAAYIISRDGINKVCNEKCKYNIETNKFNFYVNNISVADIFLYAQCNTWVYKYNFISTKDEDSLIHNNHITYHKKSSLYQLQVIKDSFWV
jgi:GR25 family glycosyltransferase involved in LPS biosynthesis